MDLGDLDDLGDPGDSGPPAESTTLDESGALDELGVVTAAAAADRSFTIPAKEAFTCVGPSPTTGAYHSTRAQVKRPGRRDDRDRHARNAADRDRTR
jgi:hypothetical protein